MLCETSRTPGAGERRMGSVQTNRKSVQGTTKKWPCHFQWYVYKLIIILRGLEVFQAQQSSFNPVPINLEILIILLLRRAAVRKEKKGGKKGASSLKQSEFWDMFKHASNFVCTLTTVVSPDFLYPTPSTSQLL
jgi:hypothetical protein